MKIILSRKGFDSSFGKIPSPIFPDGSMTSLPIPSTAGISASSIQTPVGPLDSLLHQLGHVPEKSPALYHLDPDLCPTSVARRPGWSPSLGQVSSAQTHLRKHDVGVGDLFLFFGWYRQVAQKAQGRWQFVKAAPNIHVLFGWLYVSDIIRPEDRGAPPIPSWLASHPHIMFRDRFKKDQNTIYVGRSTQDNGASVSGGGVFKRYSPELQLTAEGCSRSIWSVPEWMLPRDRTPLTYHDNPKRWVMRDDKLFLNTVGRGQEFVLDADQYPEALPWAQNLIQRHA